MPMSSGGCPVTAFDNFVAASTYKSIVAAFRDLTACLGLDPLDHAVFYTQLKSSLHYWKAQKLWALLDKRAAHKEYKRQRVGASYKVLVIGAGPCGLRAAIECAFLGAKVVVAEKRDKFSRNNVLHIWPWVIADLKNLGAKLFYPKFCAGSIDHISIRQLQCLLLKVALVLGVEVHEGLGFAQIVAPGPDPRTDQPMGWRALFEPPHHFLEEWEFNVLIGADGKRNTVPGFARRELRGKLAIGITVNFKNRRSQAEEQVPEISGVAFIFNQQFFKDMKAETGIDLENIVYYKDETHYFVMCAKKASLLEKGVIVSDFEEAAALLNPSNVDNAALLDYARQAADFATQKAMPALEFAVNGFGVPDVAMFDFTSLFSAENSCRVLERGGRRLVLSIVGDSLHEPFWPTGSGAARGFLGVLDTAWLLRTLALGKVGPLDAIAERETVYRRLAQTTPRNLATNFARYTMDPRTRYPVSQESAVLPHHVLELYDTDDPGGIREHESGATHSPVRRRSAENVLEPQVAVEERSPYLRRQSVMAYVQGLLGPYNLRVFNLDLAWADGVLLCALLHRFHPSLVDLARVNEAPASENLRLAFRLLRSELELRPPDALLVALGLPPGTEIGEETRLPEEWDVDREALLELLCELREKLRVLVAEKMRLLALSAPAAASPPSGERKRRARNARANDNTPAPPSRALLESNRKAALEIGDGPEMELSDSELKDANVDEEEVAAWLASWADDERTTRHERRVADIRADLLANPKAPHNLDPRSGRAGLVEKLDPGRVRSVEALLLGDLPGRVHELQEKKRRTAGVKARKLRPGEIQDMERKLEETGMGNLLYRKDYEKPFSRQESLMVAATTADLKAKAAAGFAKDPTALDARLAELDAKLRMPNKSGALSVRELKESVIHGGGSGGLSSRPSQESLKAPSTPPPPVPLKKVALFPKPTATPPVAKVAAMPRPATLPTGLGRQGPDCFLCDGRVYLAERLQVEGLTLHKRCFRCAFCQAPLRLGGYGFERSEAFGQQFWCMAHLKLPAADKFARLKRRSARGSPATTPGRIRNSATPPSTPSLVKVTSSVPIASLPSLVAVKPTAPKSTVAAASPDAFAPFTNSIFARASLMGGDGADGRSSASQTPERAEFELSFALAAKAPSPSKGTLRRLADGSGELDEEEIQRRNHLPAALEQEEEDVNEAERESAAASSSSSVEEEEEELWDWQRAELNSTLSRVGGGPGSLSYQDAAAIARHWREHGSEEDGTGEELDSEDEEEEEDPPSPPVDPAAIRAATLRRVEAARADARGRARLKSDTELLTTPAARLSAPALAPRDLPIPENRCASVADGAGLAEELERLGIRSPPDATTPSNPDVHFRRRPEASFLSRLAQTPTAESPPAPEAAPASESGKEAKVKAKMGRLAQMKRRRPKEPSEEPKTPPKATVDDEMRLTEEEEDAPPPRVAKSKSRDSVLSDTAEVSEHEVRRVQRAAEKLLLEQERGRAYEAQELQRSLAEQEVRRAEIRDAGLKADARLRALMTDSSPAISEGRREACLSHWVVLAKEAARLRARGADLQLRKREIELEQEHGRLQLELRASCEEADPRRSKTNAQLEQEQAVLESMLGNVRARDALIGEKAAAKTALDAATSAFLALRFGDPLPDAFGE